MKWSLFNWRNVAVSSTRTVTEIPTCAKVVGTAAACERIVSRTVSALDYEVTTDGVTWVVNDNILDKIFTRTFTESFAYLAASLSSYGRALLVFRNDRLEPYDPKYAEIKYDVRGGVYEIRDTTTNQPMESRIFICSPAPGDWPIGRGVLDEVPDAIEAERGAYIGANNILQNKTVFGAVVSAPEGMGQTQLDDVVKSLQEAYSGKERGKVVGIGTAIKVDQLDTNMDGMLSSEVASSTKKMIAAAYGVPIDMIDTEDSNKASVVDATSRYMRFTVLPIAWLICDTLSRSGFLPHFGIKGIRPAKQEETQTEGTK